MYAKLILLSSRVLIWYKTINRIYQIMPFCDDDTCGYILPENKISLMKQLQNIFITPLFCLHRSLKVKKSQMVSSSLLCICYSFLYLISISFFYYYSDAEKRNLWVPSLFKCFSKFIRVRENLKPVTSENVRGTPNCRWISLML